MKKVLYTAIFGDYDKLLEPTCVTQDWNYLCFTDNNKLKSNSWKIIVIKDVEDYRLKAREIKVLFQDCILLNLILMKVHWK